MTTCMPLSSHILHVTTSGLDKLRETLAETESRYQDICEQRRIAHDLSGDGWHDNPEFNRLQQMEAFLNGEMKRLLSCIEKSRIFTVMEGSRPVDRVWLGSIVELEIVDDETGNSHCEIWEITGHGESSAPRGLLSYDAPLARAVLTLQPGEWADEISLRGRMVSLQVLALHAHRPEVSPFMREVQA